MKDKYIVEKYQEMCELIGNSPHKTEADNIILLTKMITFLDEIYEKGKEEGIDILQGLSIKN